MTGDESKFISLESIDGGDVTFGDNKKGKIIGVGKVILHSKCSLRDVYLVKGLKHNLVSISQLCDKGYRVTFEHLQCKVFNDNELMFEGNRKDNIYILNVQDLSTRNVTCLSSICNDPWVWHKRLGHASMHLISKLSRLELVTGLPKLNFEKDSMCDACQQGKQTRSSFKAKDMVSTSRPLELLHMDLFGPTPIRSYGGKNYVFVIVDDFSRFTWVIFLTSKDEAFKNFEVFCKRVQREKGYLISKIRSDHGREFENKLFENLCNEYGISHNFSTPRTPQQNGVVERKNRTLQEMARTMLIDNNVPQHFWAEAVNTACFVLNRCLIRPLLRKTPYELWKGRKPNIGFFHPFGCKCFIHINGKEATGKFDARSQEGISLGTLITVKLIVSSTRKLSLLKNLYMWYLMSLTPRERKSQTSTG